METLKLCKTRKGLVELVKVIVTYEALKPLQTLFLDSRTHSHLRLTLHFCAICWRPPLNLKHTIVCARYNKSFFTSW